MYELNICEYKVKLWLHNLTLLLIPIILIITFIFKEKHTYIYAPISLGICTLIICLNFPAIVVSLHTRPIYYDDLVIKDYNEDESQRIYDNDFRKKYQKVFRVAIAITSSILVTITTIIWYCRDNLLVNNETNTKPSKMFNFVVVIGLIGGLLRIYYGAIMLIGKILMFILKHLKKREQRRIHEQEQEIVMYRLTQEGITLGTPWNTNKNNITLNIDDFSDNEDFSDDEYSDKDSDSDIKSRLGSSRTMPRSQSCSNMKVIGFKPQLMNDIFNENPN